MGVCYIVGAGDFNTPFLPSSDDLVIAADGGYDHLKKYKIRCDLMLGDLDSVKDPPKDVDTLKFPVRKDETDAYLAYREGARRGYETFYIYGGTGGREDHTFANYCLLLYIKEHGGNGFLVSERSRVSVLKNESVTLVGKCGKHLSLFPLGAMAHGVSIKGAEYECENISLYPNFPLAVSNIFSSFPVFIEVRDGALLVMEEI